MQVNSPVFCPAILGILGASNFLKYIQIYLLTVSLGLLLTPS